MIELPDSYRVEKSGKRLNLKNFFPPSLATTDRRRLRNCLKKVVLTHQIVGETIPSLINDRHHCDAILFLELELADIRHKDFVSKTVQPMMKALSVLHLHDASGAHALSFAHKRLSQTAEKEIVIEGHYCTDSNKSLSDFAAIRLESLLNLTNKRDLYLEAMTKAFLVDHPKVFIGAEGLHGAPLWYHGESIAKLFHQLTALRGLKREKERLTRQADKAALNQHIKNAIDALKIEFSLVG